MYPRDLLPRKLNRIDKRERKAPKTGGDYTISVLVSSMLACPEKVNTRENKTNLEVVVKTKNFLWDVVSSRTAFFFFFLKRKPKLSAWKLFKIYNCDLV